MGLNIDNRQYPRRQEAEKRESFEVNVIHYFLFDIQFAKGLEYKIYKIEDLPFEEVWLDLETIFLAKSGSLSAILLSRPRMRRYRVLRGSQPGQKELFFKVFLGLNYQVYCSISIGYIKAFKACYVTEGAEL